MLQKTARRENYEAYARFLLSRVGLSDNDIEEYMTSAHPQYDNKSVLEMIYSGDATKVIEAIESETFINDIGEIE